MDLFIAWSKYTVQSRRMVKLAMKSRKEEQKASDSGGWDYGS